MSASPTGGKAKCTVSGTQPPPGEGAAGLGVPGQQQGQGEPSGSVQLAPVSGPVCREVRLSFGSVQRREGGGRSSVPGRRPEEVGLGAPGNASCRTPPWQV